MNRILFAAADFLARPPGFYVVLGMLMALAAAAYFWNVDVVNFALSQAAIVITGIVLIDGNRNTAALHAKMDEMLRAQEEARNEFIGIEREQPEEIEEKREDVEKRKRDEEWEAIR